MTDLSSYLYSPAIRTRSAELVGLSKINNDPFGGGLLPLFELTRSRRTKSNPEGSVELSLEALLKIVEESSFVVDVTSLNSLTNAEVEKLLDPSENFKIWRDFCSGNLPETAIPVVHLTDPYDSQSVSVQIENFMARHGCVALRIPSDFDDIEELITTVQGQLGDLSDVAVYADVGLVTERGLSGAKARAREIALAVSELRPGLLASLASSFPSTVTPYGDKRGQFSLQEVALSDYLKEEFAEINCVHGDYACIHPKDMEGMAINWVPRVDVPLESSLFYYRHRRHEGGYIRAAAGAFADADYVPLNCWADENIKLAAAGNPAGKAPAFWISVRLNFHIERQLVRLGA